MDNQVHYNPDQDRSEEYGWEKYSVELARYNTPEFEASQQRWAGATIALSAVIGLLVVFLN